MSDERLPDLSVRQDGVSRTSVGLDAVTTLIHSFASMMTAMESRLTDRMRENAEHAKERWQEFQDDFRQYQDKTDSRLAILEKSVHEHHTAEERRELERQARVKPVRSVLGWTWDHWRDLVLLAIGLFAAVTFIVDALGHMFGLP